LASGVADLQPVFAPVESADEALSYALAVADDNYYAAFGLKIHNDGSAKVPYPTPQYLVARIEDTHVEETTEGYLVHLFRSPACLCGYETYAVGVLVTREGQVLPKSTQLVDRASGPCP